jgi:dienelactone hydrolase
MTDMVLFHHVQGLTPGLRDLAARLSDDEHVVHLPDLYGGRTFDTLQEGFAYMKSLDDAEVDRAVDAAVAGLAKGLVYGGVSWGVAHAQRLAQTRPGAGGGDLLLEVPALL